mmetsp:Transcript_16147/g.65250  ORF Transcript_16147/g.65250 Transcript_16147/m.65250 type:complete len:214 (-) Transcript_16147:422-1063(-)
MAAKLELEGAVLDAREDVGLAPEGLEVGVEVDEDVEFLARRRPPDVPQEHGLAVLVERRRRREIRAGLAERVDVAAPRELALGRRARLDVGGPLPGRSVRTRERGVVLERAGARRGQVGDHLPHARLDVLEVAARAVGARALGVAAELRARRARLALVAPAHRVLRLAVLGRIRRVAAGLERVVRVVVEQRACGGGVVSRRHGVSIEQKAHAT